MEHVLNAKLRNQALWKFLAPFLVTIIIVGIVVYFSCDVPVKENTALRADKNNSNKKFNLHQEFNAILVTTKSLIDSMRKTGQYNAIIDQEIAESLHKLNSPEYLDSNNIYAMENKEALIFLNDYYEIAKSNLKLKNAAQKLDSLTNVINSLQQKYDGAEQSLEICRGGSNLNQ